MSTLPVQRESYDVIVTKIVADVATRPVVFPVFFTKPLASGAGC